jgi:hypothetical protein
MGSDVREGSGIVTKPEVMSSEEMAEDAMRLQYEGSYHRN